MPNFALRLLLPAIALNLLTSCATENSSSSSVCPPIMDYSRDFQERLAIEIEHASPDAVFPLALQDYAQTRAELHACH